RSRLLLVEDDHALAALLKEYLESGDYEVTWHTRGDTALAALKQQPFDVVLSDIVLPGADGREILQKTGGDPARTLVFLMTGYSGIEDALNALQEGAYDFISKPFQLPEIRVRLDNGMRYQQLLRHVMAHEKEPEGQIKKQHEDSHTAAEKHTAARAYSQLSKSGTKR
ncbi:MAG TPA: response regulator, partial [Mariprofundaceae bacterium]|nr:response regulator [Mariprofundaceae bacterium]